MLAGDFRIVELDGVGGVASEADRVLVQLEAGALIVAADHEQRWHRSHSESRPSGAGRGLLQALRAKARSDAASNSSILRISGP